MTNGQRSRLIWPVANRHGQTVYLSTGQRTLLTYVHTQMRYGRHVHKLAHLARVTGLDPSNVSRGLDRLASMQIIGRRSTRGCLGQTVTWRLRSRTSRALNRRANVATSTSFGGYLTREGWKTAIHNREDRAVRRLTPPRLLYGRCAAGHSVRLVGFYRARIPSTDPTIARVLEGGWSGRCRRCPATLPTADRIVRITDRVTVPATERGSGWSRPSDFVMHRGAGGRIELARRGSTGGSA